ncbi:MAG TPA: hypothetical protein VMH00_03005 [Candidatus Limnocylindrales bacterium]|nr:hypothetical protein [Candidatus Limnocylindrales bacterium]
MRLRLPFLAAIAILLAAGVRADELKLKDGTKIVGTIVGFEDSSFKVKTSYGFAVVQRDQVVSISVTDAAKKADSAKKAEAEKKADAEKKPEAASATESKTEAHAPATAASTPTGATASAPAAVKPMQPASSTTVASATPGPVAAPAAAPTEAPKPAMPEPVHEQVVGNTYMNDTYGFYMYKPPDWRVIEGARAMLPGTITAMGTGDQTTYLLIGQDAAGKSLASDMDATEKRLRDIMANFQPLGDKRIMVSGSEGIERRFRGSVDQHDWSGVVVLVPHGVHVYTIFGMTYADSDLVQIQENVISRAISSLKFTKQ